MVGCGSLSDCGEECEIQLSASSPAALTLCVSDRRLALSHYDKPHIASFTGGKKQIAPIPQKWKVLSALLKACRTCFCHPCYLPLHGHVDLLSYLVSRTVCQRSTAFVSPVVSVCECMCVLASAKDLHIARRVPRLYL